MHIILIGFTASLIAGLATSLGTIPVLFIRKISAPLQDGMLGFAAGVMLTASFFSLIVPSLDIAEQLYHSSLHAVSITIAGLALGVGAIWTIEYYAPHQHFITGVSGKIHAKISRIWLFIIAITLHNFPEGMAVGVSFGGDDIARGTSMAIAIGLQNIPEGLAVALSMMAVGYSRATSVCVALLSGLVEPIGGLLGISVVTLSEPLLPWGLSFSAGAMLFVISHEIIPETHRNGHENGATFGFMIGLFIMLFLDTCLV